MYCCEPVLVLVGCRRRRVRVTQSAACDPGPAAAAARAPAAAAAAAGDGAASVADVMLAETAGHVYRLLHGVERCCWLDTPSCVLTGLVVYDRLSRRQLTDQSPQTTAAGVDHPATTGELGGRQTATDPGPYLNG